jgi:hypothetical protein
VVALVMVASVVTGSPWTSSPQPVVEPVEQSVAPEPQTAPGALDLDSLERRKTSGTVPDLFANPAPAAPPASPVRVATVPASGTPPPPQLPALAFRYLGRMEAGERTVVFLERGQNLYSVAAGETLDGTYRVESISDSAVTFRHLSLGVAQTLAIPKAP